MKEWQRGIVSNTHECRGTKREVILEDIKIKCPFRSLALRFQDFVTRLSVRNTQRKVTISTIVYIDVLVNLYGSISGERKKALNCSIRCFLWCKFFHHHQFEATTMMFLKTELGRDELIQFLRLI